MDDHNIQISQHKSSFYVMLCETRVNKPEDIFHGQIVSKWLNQAMNQSVCHGKLFLSQSLRNLEDACAIYQLTASQLQIHSSVDAL